MTTIDQRVVQMKFDNAQFGTGAASTLKMLAQLNSALKMPGASAGLSEVSNTMGRFSTDGAQNQVNALGRSFTALQAIALTALTNIVNKVIDAGLRMANSLSFEPVLGGLKEYETNLGSIQTVLANTGLTGSEGLAKVNGALDTLNQYSDKTIYNFSEMAKNVGTFTAAGIDLDTSTQAIKGIANLAALSGSNAQQASTAMYQLSQSLSTGKVSLEDWNSVVNAGMGGKVFQESLKETARAHGVAVDDIMGKSGSFRNSLQEGWLTSGILTETLSKFTGELTADQLKSMGYTEDQIAGIMEMAETATNAATKVKTMSQLLDTLREAAGSGWAKTWSIIFGDFDEAKDLFTGVNEVLGGMITRSAETRNNLLQGWKDLGGRDALIDGISNAFQALMSILKPIKDAFRQIFPASTAKSLYDMTVSFRDFMERLKLGEETANNLRRTFAGFFAILGIGWELIKAGVKFIANLIGSFSNGSGGILKFTGNIGDFLVALHRAIKDGEGFTKFFNKLAAVIQIPINWIRQLVSWIGQLFKNDESEGPAKALGKMGESLKSLGKMAEKTESSWESFQAKVRAVVEWLEKAGKKLVEWGKSVGSAIAGAFSGISFDEVLGAVNTGLFAGLVLILKKFMGGIGDFLGGGAGIFDGVIGALDGLTGALKGMQNGLNAAALLMIAIAIGILTISLIALSNIDSAGLTRASVAIAVMFGQLGLAFVAFSKIGTTGQMVKVTVMAAAMILMATAIRILASSVEKFSNISFPDLLRGLIAVSLLMKALVSATNGISANTSGIIRASVSMILLATAIKILVSSVKELGGMDWASLAKGLVGVGTLLAALALYSKFAAADKGGISSGIGIVLLATGLKILASAVGDFVQFNWEQIARGMAGIGVGLGLMTAALNLMPQSTILKAAGLVIVAASLKLLAEGVQAMSGLQWDEIARGMTVLAGALGSIAIALRLIPPGSILNAAAILIVATSLQMLNTALSAMGGMTWEEIAKGLTVLAASLLVISAALLVAQGTLTGSIAITLMAIALNMLVPVLIALGEMPWEVLLQGLLGLAGIFVIIGVAGLVLGPLVPVIFGLAASIALLSLSVLAAGLGVLAFATGLSVLATAGGAAVVAIVGIVSGLVGLIPYVMEQIALGLVAFAKVIAVSGPAITDALVTVLNSLLDAIIQATPKIVQMLITMLTQMLNALVQAIPKMVEAGMKILIGFLKGVADNIGKVVDQGARIIVEFINGIARNIGKIIEAGINLIIATLNGIGQGISNNGAALAEAGWNIIKGIIEGIIKGIGALAKKVIDAIIGLAKDMWNGVMDFFGISSPSKKMIWMSKQLMLGTEKGLDKYGYLATDATVGVGENMIDSMGKTLDGLSSVLGSDLIDFDPTITPVLDLSAVKKDASEISRILALPKMDVGSAAFGAQDARAGFEENRTVDGANDDSTDGGDTYNYTQNNNSPKALSEEEIYRNTKNLLSRTRGESDA